MRGYDFHPIKWLNDRFGYQKIVLPAHITIRAGNTRGRSNYPLTHVKVWENRPTGRVAVTRFGTITKAREYIKRRSLEGTLL